MRYSKQREAIYRAVSCGDHPTADDVYAEVLKEHPNISLGTVYRNLNRLAETGRLVRIPQSGREDRFDADVSEHFHVRCTSCGAFDDIPIPACRDIAESLERICEKTGMSVAPEHVHFQWTCPACGSEQNSMSVENINEKGGESEGSERYEDT